MKGRYSGARWTQKAMAAAERKYGMSNCQTDGWLRGAAVRKKLADGSWVTWVQAWVKVTDEEVKREP